MSGLPDGHRLVEWVRLKSERDGDPGRFVMASIQIDGLAHVARRVGGFGGDQAVRDVARALQRVVASEGRAYRTGRDEFSIIFDGPWTEGVLSLAFTPLLQFHLGRTCGTIGDLRPQIRWSTPGVPPTLADRSE